MRSNLIVFAILLLTLFSNESTAQYDFPDPGHVFSENEVPRVDIEIDPGLLNFILDPNNEESNTEYPATFYFTRAGEIDTVENVGFRLRGNTSRASAKKSFKVSFNSFEQGKRYKGLEKMNLNGEHNDPTILRSKACWDLYQMVGIPSSRSNHVELYVNSEYRGLYLNVEHIDERFIKKRFASDEGNLYKCLWPADLTYLGNDPELYKNEDSGRRAYDLKTNTELDDYSGFAHFIDILNNKEGEDFKCEFEAIFDVDNYLKAIVMDILVSNWDGPIVNKNNFYLYHDLSTNRFTYIPFDLDNTMGIGWGGTQWEETDIYYWSDTWGNAERPLYEKIMAVEEYRNKVSYYFEQFTSDFFNNAFLDPYFDEFKEKLTPFRENDAYAELDYGWDIEAFKKSYDQGLGAHVPLGLKQYVDQRNSSVQEQLDLQDPLTIFEYYGFMWGGENILFDIKVHFPWDVVGTVKLHYQYDDGSWQELEMGSNNDVDYSIMLSNQAINNINYFFEASNFAGVRRWPYCGNESLPASLEPGPHLVINEFMASNDTRNTDEAGEHEDWIEIYNTADIEINPSAYYLTDDPTNPGKWQINSDFLPADGYLKIWADEDGDQGDLHANFKLSRGGEFLGLFFKKEDVFFPIDTLTFPEQTTDVSYGRLPNGFGEFQVLPYPTFGLNNEGPSKTQEISNDLSISIFPNPAADFVKIESQESAVLIKSVEILSIDGQTIFTGSQVGVASLLINLTPRDLTNKLYILRIRTNENKVVIKKLAIVK